MGKVRIKICGITRPEDGLEAARAGADAIGLIFAANSPRLVTLNRAREIIRALPPFVSAVGVFVNEAVDTVRKTVLELGLSLVQLHGDETPEIAAALAPVPVVKALRVRTSAFEDDVQRFQKCGVTGILLDAFAEEARGGSGKRFDWDLVTGAQHAGGLDDSPPLILAGGLTHDNVAAAIRRVRPWGVDVSSGVEDSPGIKSPEKIARFIDAVRSA